MRTKADFNKEVKRFMESPDTDIITEFTATADGIKTVGEPGCVITKETKLKIGLVK